MPGLNIYSIPNRLGYAGHWKKQREDIKEVIDEHGAEILGTTDFQNWMYINEFASQVDEMLAQIADILLATDFDKFMANAEDEFQGEE